MLSDTVTRSMCLVPCPVCVITSGHEERVSNKANTYIRDRSLFRSRGRVVWIFYIKSGWEGKGQGKICFTKRLNWSGEFEQGLHQIRAVSIQHDFSWCTVNNQGLSTCPLPIKFHFFYLLVLGKKYSESTTIVPAKKQTRSFSTSPCIVYW